MAKKSTKALVEKTPEQLARDAQILEASQVPAVRSENECDRYISDVGDLQRELELIELSMNEELEKLKASYAERAVVLEAELTGVLGAIEVYCEGNRAALTDDGKVKTHRFNSGIVNWRDAPPKVSLRKIESVLAWLLEQRGKFRKFVRVKHEIDKETMLKHPELAEQVPGVKIQSAGEAFYVTPNQTNIEVLA